jgi:hypothetical protein
MSDLPPGIGADAQLGRGMNEAPDDTATAKAPRHTRRLSDKILIAFHQACDQSDFEVAERLLDVLGMMMTAAPRPSPGSDRRRDRDEKILVAAHERLWQLRHPDLGED